MVALTQSPLDPRRIEAAVSWTGAGAVLTFLGNTRDSFEGRAVLGLDYEAYPEMAIPELAKIEAEIVARWPGSRVVMVHRLGAVGLGETSVVISVSSPHRAAVYEASRYAIEALKARVPIWKRERYRDGASWKANAPVESA